MPHAPSAAASCGWGYDALARLQRAVSSAYGYVDAMHLTQLVLHVMQRSSMLCGVMDVGSDRMVCGENDIHSFGQDVGASETRYFQ